jgi:glycosyltransferase involved in cell wall biosynthesis
MPMLLAAVDAVPVPQLDMPFAQSQLPAKALEAMAMACAVITTRVGDLPEILGEGLDTMRGWLVPPGNPAALAAALVEIAARPDEARARGRAAREWFLEEASQAVIESRLLSLIGRITQPQASIVAAV